MMRWFLIVTGLWLSTLSFAQDTQKVEIIGFKGDIDGQKFSLLKGELQRISTDVEGSDWECLLRDGGDGSATNITFLARCEGKEPMQSWSYKVINREPDFTVSEVAFPIVQGIRIGDSWRGNQIYWPSMYRGALITDLRNQSDFEAQASLACKQVPYLHGDYQGDLCLPFFVHTGPRASYGISVLDPTNEVVTFDGYRFEDGMTYRIATHPKILTGKSWSFGKIEIRTTSRNDWHPYADNYRKWARTQGFIPKEYRGDIATMTYGRWDDLRPEEVIRWAKAYDARDVLLWVVLYGRGDQYYPCYFPKPEEGIAGMKAKLAQLRKEGLAPYFYTNGYLLSPFQKHEDALKWNKEHPEQYEEYLAKGDTGYAETVAEFRKSYDFAGDWLQTPGGLEPLRVLRVSYQWGKTPVYLWHGRPFWAACVNSPEWLKLMRDTARLHAEMGAQGVFIDQVAAMHPELCSATGHNHDDDSFGFWNRAYTELLRQMQQEADRVTPGFFLEAEGAADRYAQYMNKYLSNFGDAPGKPSFPQMLRYAAPWVRTDHGCVRPGSLTPEQAAQHVEETLLLGSIFRVNGAVADGPEDVNAPELTSESMMLLRAGIQARRLLVPWMDENWYMDEVGLTSVGCSDARWFEGENGALIVLRTDIEGAGLKAPANVKYKTSLAWDLDWRTGKKRPVKAMQVGSRLVFEELSRGFHIIAVPK